MITLHENLSLVSAPFPGAAYVKAKKATAWGTLPAGVALIDEDQVGQFMAVVKDPTGDYLRLWYPKDHVGVQTALGKQSFSFKLTKPGTVVRVEYDHMYETGFDLSTGPGKPGPIINVGPEAGPLGTDVMFTWGSTVTTNPKPENAILQRQDGVQLMQPPVYTANVVKGVWTHRALEVRAPSTVGGADGYAQWEINGAVVKRVTGSLGNISLADDILVKMQHFAGGAQAHMAESWGRRKNSFVYIGVAGTGNPPPPVVTSWRATVR